MAALELAAPKIELSDHQRDEIYRTIGFDSALAEIELPKDVSNFSLICIILCFTHIYVFSTYKQ
jgi:hypothetical protein